MIIFLKTHDYFQNINVSVLFFLRKYAYSISLVITDSNNWVHLIIGLVENMTSPARI